MDEVYVFSYCDCLYTSQYSIISLHKTKKGAYKAMNKYINDKFTQDREDNIRFGTYVGISGYPSDHVFEDKGYLVETIQLKQ
ncbi:MAG: hypothetical protein COA36_16790 [Desulfotalea sp.]|nr:MAG: hypothetical protein COA36_16790 [Desulfotalea sp.]